MANVSPEERLQYGSVNEQNKLIINKAKDYRESEPSKSSPDVDWTEFMNDHESRRFKANVIARLEAIMQGLTNSKLLHDWDNYQAALLDYKYTKYKNDTNASGYENKANEMAQFFNRTGQ